MNDYADSIESALSYGCTMFHHMSRQLFLPISSLKRLERSRNLKERLVILDKRRKKLQEIIDSQKNHINFLKSLSYIKHPIHFILLGRGVDGINLSKYDIKKNISITLMGEINNIFPIYDTFDFLLLPSIYGEAFPNVLMEAMSRGVVCISSDVGDSLSIISSTGYVIKDPYDPLSIAESIKCAVEDFDLNHAAYRLKSGSSILQIRSNFKLSNIIAKYNHTWMS